jgi:hypothetical protein
MTSEFDGLEVESIGYMPIPIDPPFFVSPGFLGDKFALRILSSVLLWSRISTAAHLSVALTCLLLMRDSCRSSEPANL